MTKRYLTLPLSYDGILNSLQMGFRTLAIQKRTSEVWNVLGAVKTEFGKFGGLLEKVQKNLQNAGDLTGKFYYAYQINCDFQRV